MQPFRFSLQRVLDWRQQQFEALQLRREAVEAELAANHQQRAQVAAGIRDAEQFIGAQDSLDAAALAGLADYRRRMHEVDRELRARRGAAEARRAAVVQECLAARRRCRLLEKLRERRRLEHEQASARELEEVASELTLARWSPRRTEPRA